MAKKNIVFILILFLVIHFASCKKLDTNDPIDSQSSTEKEDTVIESIIKDIDNDSGDEIIALKHTINGERLTLNIEGNQYILIDRYRYSKHDEFSLSICNLKNDNNRILVSYRAASNGDSSYAIMVWLFRYENGNISQVEYIDGKEHLGNYNINPKISSKLTGDTVHLIVDQLLETDITFLDPFDGNVDLKNIIDGEDKLIPIGIFDYSINGNTFITKRIIYIDFMITKFAILTTTYLVEPDGLLPKEYQIEKLEDVCR